MLRPNITNLTAPIQQEFSNSSTSICPLPYELFCPRAFYPEFVSEVNKKEEGNTTNDLNQMMPLSVEDDENGLWMNISISPAIAIISFVVFLFILDLPWWKQFAGRVYTFLTEGKRKGKELEETKVMLSLAKEESEMKQQQIQELEQKLKSTEEKLNHAEDQIQEEEHKSASLEAQVEFLQKMSKSEQDKMESKLEELTEQKNEIEEEMKQISSQCLELVSVVKNRDVEEEQESDEQVLPDERKETSLRAILEDLSIAIHDSFERNSKEKNELMHQIESLQEQDSHAQNEIAQLSEKVAAGEKQAESLMQELTKERQQAKAVQKAHEKSMEEVVQEKNQETKKAAAAAVQISDLKATVAELRERVLKVRDEILDRKEYELGIAFRDKDEMVANAQKELDKQKRVEALFTQLLLQELSTIKPDESASTTWKSTLDSLFANCKAKAISQCDSELAQEHQGPKDDRVLFKRHPSFPLSKQPHSQDELVTQSTPSSPTEPTLFGGLIQTSNPNFQASTKAFKRPRARKSLGSFM